MVGQVVEMGWIFEMDLVGVMVKLAMREIEENILDFSNKIFSNLVSMIGFGVEMAKVAKERVCSNYFEMDVHNIEIVN